jgi:hypothetical protein
MPNFSWRVWCGLVINITVCTHQLAAGLIDEHSWSVVSPDGRYILVMLMPESLRIATKKDFETYHPGEVYQEEGAELRIMYPVCGVYANDGSTKLLWKIPWYIPAYEVYFSDDGEHVLIAQGDSIHMISNIPVGAQLFFHHQDGSHKAWPEQEVGWSWCLRFLFCRFILDEPFWYAGLFEHASETYIMETTLQETFVFDITTGQLTSSSSLWNKGIVAFFVTVPLCVYYMLRPDSGLAAAKRSYMQFSMRMLLVAMTLVGAWFWLVTVNWILAMAIIIPIAIGGGIARLCSRKPRAWITGTLLAIYGCVWGMFLWGFFIEPMIWETHRDEPYVWFLPAFAVIGLIGGAIIAGILERRTIAKFDSLRSSANSC